MGYQIVTVILPRPGKAVKDGRNANCSLSDSCVLVPRIDEGDAPKGQGESE